MHLNIKDYFCDTVSQFFNVALILGTVKIQCVNAFRQMVSKLLTLREFDWFLTHIHLLQPA